MPQGASAGFTARGEVVEGEDELVALVTDVRGSVSERRLLHYNLLVTLTLAFVGVQDLEYPGNLSSVCTVHISLSDRSYMEQFINFQSHERVGLLSVLLTVVEQNLLTAHNYILSVPAKALCVLGGK